MTLGRRAASSMTLGARAASATTARGAPCCHAGNASGVIRHLRFRSAFLARPRLRRPDALRPTGVQGAGISGIFLDLMRSTLEPLCKVYPDSTALFEAALDSHGRYKHSFYDSLIIAAALDARCELLYSEDLQHGQQIRRLRIVNPFVS